MSEDRVEQTRESWNVATAMHNRHKGDQAARLRAGELTVYPEELVLLGDLKGKRVLHLQCNAGQDTLSLAALGAEVTGVDLSDEAIDFARRLSEDSGVSGRFFRAEVVSFLAEHDETYDLVFASYGALPWIGDLSAWMAGARRVLAPEGRLVVLELHPLVWSYGDKLDLGGDSYFESSAFDDPVSDYVGAAFGEERGRNTVPAWGYQHTVADILNAVMAAGLQLEQVQEYPYANFCKFSAGLQERSKLVWEMPEGKPNMPMMFGFTAR